MIRIWFYAIVAFFVFSVSAQAAKTTLTYALFSRGWPPLEMMTNGEPHGLAVDILKEVLPDDVELTVTPMPAPRRSLYSVEGGVYVRLEAREWMRTEFDYWWSDPVLPLVTSLCSPIDRPLEYKGLHSLEGKTIGCIRNYSYPFIEGLFRSGKATRYDVNSDQVQLRMLKAKRVDAAVIDRISAGWIVRHMKDVSMLDFYVAPKPLGAVSLRFAFNRVLGWEKVLPEINRKLRQIKKNGTLERLLQKYR